MHGRLRLCSLAVLDKLLLIRFRRYVDSLCLYFVRARWDNFLFFSRLFLNCSFLRPCVQQTIDLNLPESEFRCDSMASILLIKNYTC